MEWEAWAQSENPYGEKLPGKYEDAPEPPTAAPAEGEKAAKPQRALDNFDKLCLVRCLRSEMATRSISQYIIKDLEQFYVEPPSTQMAVLYEDLANCIPMIFVLSKGADPTSSLYKFAADRGLESDRILAISLGQGQGGKASKCINQAMEDGSWVLLQNCHLARFYMETLEKYVLGFAEAKETIHPDFRLFLSSMPAGYFPVAVLQNSLKLTTEPPRGLKANLKRCYANYSQDFLDGCPSKAQVWRKLVFSFSFFHALVQERRKFGPLGWNIRYEFNDSDLETSNIMLKGFLETQDEIPWDAILQVTGIINYGGRVTDANDLTCLMTTLEKYCSQASLGDSYKYSPLPTYYAPADCKLEGYRDYINNLPLVD
jgi:dynein heavy chain, axonemal